MLESGWCHILRGPETARIHHCWSHTDNKWSNWILLSKLKDSNMMKDTIRPFCSMIMPGPMSQKQWQKPYKYLIGKNYLTRHINQTLLHPTTTCFHPCIVSFYKTTSVPVWKAQNGSTNGLLPGSQIFFIAKSICCLKNGKILYFSMESILNKIYFILLFQFLLYCL